MIGSFNLSGDDDTALNMENIDVEVLKEVVHEVVMKWRTTKSS